MLDRMSKIMVLGLMLASPAMMQAAAVFAAQAGKAVSKVACPPGCPRTGC